VEEQISTILEPGGVLSRIMPAYEFRPQQLQMALDIWDTFQNKDVILAEAGTGTGKSLAYLIPAALFDRPVIISTGTKNLQEQLYFHDVPLLRKILDNPVDAVLMKGRSNYLCKKRMEQVKLQGSMDTDLKQSDLKAFFQWAETTRTGDRSELEFLSDNSGLWQQVCSRPETCLGPFCSQYNSCHVVRLKIKAQKADLIIINHHLYFADAMLRSRNRPAPLPDVDALVFDEAHVIDEIATEFMGIRINQKEFVDYLSLLSLFKPDDKKQNDWDLDEPVNGLKEASGIYFGMLGTGEGRFTLESKYNDELRKQSVRVVHALDELLKAILTSMSIPGESKGELEFRLRDMADSIAFIDAMDDPDYVFWGDYSRGSPTLHANPVDISIDLPRLMRQPVRPLVLTSATLTVKASFDYCQSRLGFHDAETMSYPSPFNYPVQAALYLPAHLPSPEAEGYYLSVANEILNILRVSRGRAFILCTSYRGLDIIHNEIRDDLGYRLFVQGEAPKHVLLDQFREEEHSVLIGTASFWQGVDVPGSALTCVIIDKLPFSSPADPLVQARISRYKSNGQRPFFEYQLPEAVMNLKQGLGRLIRSKTDRGFAVILDHRVFKRRYGSVFLNSIPDFTCTHDIDDLGGFVD
jgi:ATP-dependent DNA helicase DinG